MTERDSKELVQLDLSEKDTSSRPGTIEEMVTDIRAMAHGLISDLSASGKNWFRGKSDQELAKAKQILSDVIDRVGRLALDEKDQTHRHRIEDENQRLANRAKDVELYLSALERVAKIIKDFADAGIDVDIRAVLRGLPIDVADVSNDVIVPKLDAALEE